ncbi:MAG: hypothetical protein WKH64_12620 [Chloroflexia bacterium]
MSKSDWWLSFTRTEGTRGARRRSRRASSTQRAEYGETQAAQDGPSPDESLPIEHFDRATVDEAGDELDDLSTSELRTVEEFEREHKDRSTLIEQIDRRLDES